MRKNGATRLKSVWDDVSYGRKNYTKFQIDLRLFSLCGQMMTLCVSVYFWPCFIIIIIWFASCWKDWNALTGSTSLSPVADQSLFSAAAVHLTALAAICILLLVVAFKKRQNKQTLKSVHRSKLAPQLASFLPVFCSFFPLFRKLAINWQWYLSIQLSLSSSVAAAVKWNTCCVCLRVWCYRSI